MKNLYIKISHKILRILLTIFCTKCEKNIIFTCSYRILFPRTLRELKANQIENELRDVNTHALTKILFFQLKILFYYYSFHLCLLFSFSILVGKVQKISNTCFYCGLKEYLLILYIVLS